MKLILRNTRVLFLFVVLLNMFSLSAQTFGNNREIERSKQILGLKIGDSIPKELWDAVLQIISLPHAQKKIKFGDFRDKKLIVLDFWATWCGSCVAAIPKTIQLEQRFENELTVLPISREAEKVVEIWGRGRKDLKYFRSVYADTLLSSYFPHRAIPHYIWIKDGKFYAQTAAEELNSTNIERLLSGKKIVLRQKNDVVDYEFDEPMTSFKRDILRQQLIAQSTLTRMVDGLSSTFATILDSIGGELRVKFTNLGVANMLVWTIRGAENVPRKRWLVNLKEPSKILMSDSLKSEREWNEVNMFCYEYKVPFSNSDIRVDVQEDLERLFNITLSMENISEDCLVLQGMPKYQKSSVNGVEFMTSRNVVFRLDRRFDLPSVLNSLDANIMLPVNRHIIENGSLPEIQAELESLGFQLSIEKRELPYLIFNQL